MVDGSQPAVVSLPLDWTGETVAGVWACEEVVLQDCKYQPEEAYGVTNTWDVPTGNLSAGQVILYWNATSPATAQLSLGLQFLNASCTDCQPVQLAPDVTGAAPLSFPVPTGIPTGNGYRLRVWVYLPLYQPAGPEVLGESLAQQFHLVGRLDFMGP